MKPLNDVIMDIRRRQRKKDMSPDQVSAFWTSTDLLDGEQVKAHTIVFQTRGCYWGVKGGCTMCGYIYDSGSVPPSADDLLRQFDSVKGRIDGGIVKIFTSGSFFDVREIPVEVRETILSGLNAEKVIIETRPEFVTEKNLTHARDLFKKIEVAVGLETSSDTIRLNCINKGFTFADFVKAADVAKANDVTVKAYLMLKPPFLTEKDAMEDIVRSVMDAAPYAQTISINLCNIQRGTLVDELFYRRAYRPPWLWSIAEILKRVHGKTGSVIMSDPLAAGSSRGPHNCGECDGAFADALRAYSLTQDIKVIEKLDCGCKALWLKTLELEEWTFGSPLVY